MYTNIPMVQALHARANQTTHALKAALATLLTLWVLHQPTNLAAQATLEVPLSSFSSTTTCTGGTLMQGDSAILTFYLGTAVNPAQHVMGLRLQFTLSDDATLANPANFSTTGSWLFSDGYFDTDLDVNDDGNLVLEVGRNNSLSKSGYGKVFTCKLICTTNNVAASSLVTATGGLVIVENVEMRQARPQGHQQQTTRLDPEPASPAVNLTMQVADEPQTLAVPYPNPTKGTLFLPHHPDAPTTCTLISLSGSTYTLPVLSQGTQPQIDMTTLPHGLYILEWPAQHRHRILKH